MADSQRGGAAERDIDQAITALKKGAYLLKYGRRGKPKFCPFHLSNDESTLIWYSGKEEKHINLSQVSRIIPGQRTAIFQRHPRPEKEYQSFSLIYSDRSLDLICKDKDEAEVWFVGLKALISHGNYRKWGTETRSDSDIGDVQGSQVPCETQTRLGRAFSNIITYTAAFKGRNQSEIVSGSPRSLSVGCGESSNSQNSGSETIRVSLSSTDIEDVQGAQVPCETRTRLGKAFSNIITYTSSFKGGNQPELISGSPHSLSVGCVESSNGRNSGSETVRVSLSSAVSSSSHGSCHDDFDSLGDVFIWGEHVGDGILGGGANKINHSSNSKIDALLPKTLESAVVLDVHNVACGGRHAVLVTKQGEIFSWGEESGGRLGHGIEADIPQPKLIDTLSGMNIELVACGEYHTCAVTVSGDLYTWGDGTHNSGMLGHGSEVSHWIPKKVCGHMEGLRVSFISCGPWHTAAVTSSGQLFTFGDGSFGVLGHGDHSSTCIPREVEALRGLRTTKVACGVWHTTAVVEVVSESSNSKTSSSSLSGQLFTWGDGDKGRLGHGDKEPRLFPECVGALVDKNICKVACGHNLTVALTTSGQVYTMGSTAYGQLGSPTANGKLPAPVEGKIVDDFVAEIACGSYHVAALTSKTEVYTWGKGANGQLGHGDIDDRNTPTLVDSLKDKQVKSVVCGSNFTAIICLHKWVPSADHSMCSGCRNLFGFRRKRHNCYNCGLVFCKACSSKKSLKASLAPNMNKPYRVCDDCFAKLKKTMESGSAVRTPKTRNGNMQNKFNEVTDKESLGQRLHSQFSRLSSFDSNNQVESRNPKRELTLESHNHHLFPAQTGNLRLGNYCSSQVSTSLVGDSKKVSPASIAGSRITSGGTSPASAKSSPYRPSEVTSDDSRQMSDTISQEIMSLRAQVEDLTSKSQRLEAELEKTSRQLREVTAIATNEAEKCKSAKEVIRSLTAQLKEMAERFPEDLNAKFNSGAAVKHTSDIRNVFSNENHTTSLISRESESNGDSGNGTISHGTKALNEKAEWVVHDEPGVYLTLSSLPGGGNELKRVRFSRKHFTEEQAEKWWAENGPKVCERHNILSGD
ncbi:hypothetical protein SLE2022_334880 [Rubroshorea leprosula]